MEVVVDGWVRPTASLHRHEPVGATSASTERRYGEPLLLWAQEAAAAIASHTLLLPMHWSGGRRQCVAAQPGMRGGLVGPLYA
jgi:hypothetical protein